MLVKEKYNSAPSFVNFIILSEPFKKSTNSLYIKALNPKTNTVREIKVTLNQEEEKRILKDQLKTIRGFADGPIKIVKTANKQFLAETPQIRFATDVGYYIISTETIDKIKFPSDTKITNLTWEEFQSCTLGSHQLL